MEFLKVNYLPTTLFTLGIYFFYILRQELFKQDPPFGWLDIIQRTCARFVKACRANVGSKMEFGEIFSAVCSYGTISFMVRKHNMCLRRYLHPNRARNATLTEGPCITKFRLRPESLVSGIISRKHGSKKIIFVIEPSFFFNVCELPDAASHFSAASD